MYIFIYSGGWGGESFVKPPTGKSFRFVRACERASRGEAVWASEKRFDPGAGAIRGKKLTCSCSGVSVLAAVVRGQPYTCEIIYPKFTLKFAALRVDFLFPANFVRYTLSGLNPSCYTPDFLNKKHVKFGHGLDFLILFTREIEATTRKNLRKARKN